MLPSTPSFMLAKPSNEDASSLFRLKLAASISQKRDLHSLPLPGQLGGPSLHQSIPTHGLRNEVEPLAGQSKQMSSSGLTFLRRSLGKERSSEERQSGERTQDSSYGSVPVANWPEPDEKKRRTHRLGMAFRRSSMSLQAQAICPAPKETVRVGGSPW